MATTKNLCAQIPIALHERVSEERERLGQTTSEYIANLIQEYTRNGQTALCRNVKYSDGTMMDGVGKGDCMDGVPGKDAHYTGYHYTKAVCETCGGINTNEPKSDYGYLKNVYWLFDCAAEFTQKLEETVTYEYTDDTYHTPESAVSSIRKSCCRPTLPQTFKTGERFGTAWSRSKRRATPNWHGNWRLPCP